MFPRKRFVLAFLLVILATIIYLWSWPWMSPSRFVLSMHVKEISNDTAVVVWPKHVRIKAIIKGYEQIEALRDSDGIPKFRAVLRGPTTFERHGLLKEIIDGESLAFYFPKNVFGFGERFRIGWVAIYANLPAGTDFRKAIFPIEIEAVPSEAMVGIVERKDGKVVALIDVFANTVSIEQK